MGDDSSAALACRDCGKEIFRMTPGGRPPLRCQPCINAARRRSKNDYKRRRRTGVQPPTTYTCLGCGNQFPRPHGGTLPQRCTDCWMVHERERGTNRRAEHFGALRRKFETEGRWTNCETCAHRFRCHRQKGLAPRWCEPCRVERWNAKRKAMRPWIRAGCCEDCGQPTDRASRAVPRRRCRKCDARRRDPQTNRFISTLKADQAPPGERPFGPAWTRRRGQWPDNFTALDIFERDKWVCGICRKKIDRSLRYPHRMSATLDHVVPVIEGGIDSRANVRPAHLSCNSSRNHRGGGEQLLLLG